MTRPFVHREAWSQGYRKRRFLEFIELVEFVELSVTIKHHYVLCVNNRDYLASLELHKVYRRIQYAVRD